MVTAVRTGAHLLAAGSCVITVFRYLQDLSTRCGIGCPTDRSTAASARLAWSASSPRTSGTRTNPGSAQPANAGEDVVVTRKLPSPLENATGSVLQPRPPTRARSVRPSPLKSAATTRTPGACAWTPAKSDDGVLVTRNVPSPL